MPPNSDNSNDQKLGGSGSDRSFGSRKSAQDKGSAHELDSDEVCKAGIKGGQAAMAELDTKMEVVKEIKVKQPMSSLAQPAGVRLSSMLRQTEKAVRVVMAAGLSNFQVVGEKIRIKEPIETRFTRGGSFEHNAEG